MIDTSKTNVVTPGQGELAKRVERTLGETHYPSLSRLHVTEQEGTIVLAGHLRSFYLKQVAQTLVASVDGVRRVVNEVVVDRPNAAAS
ncbi:MAG: BON domain-containing protein [Planctomycetaceae bacterium]|nr:BON domain-containing protein [Planctomycetaceae bacterium]